MNIKSTHRTSCRLSADFPSPGLVQGPRRSRLSLAQLEAAVARGLQQVVRAAVGGVSSEQPEQSGEELSAAGTTSCRLKVKFCFTCSRPKGGWGAPPLCWTPATTPNQKEPNCRTAAGGCTPEHPAPRLQGPPTAASGVRDHCLVKPAAPSSFQPDSGSVPRLSEPSGTDESLGSSGTSYRLLSRPSSSKTLLSSRDQETKNDTSWSGLGEGRVRTPGRTSSLCKKLLC